MARVLVTGATGAVGSRLLPALRARGHTVVGLGRRLPDTSTPLEESVRGDLLDPTACDRAAHGCDAVVHLAAATGRARPDTYIRTNVQGTANVVRAAERAGARRFVLLSSVAARYPDHPRLYYARSKAAAERLVQAAPLEVAILRPTQVFGRGSGPFEALVRLAGLPLIPAFGGARTLVQPVFVDDLASMIVDVLEGPPGDTAALEFGGPEVMPLRSVIEKVRQHLTGRPGRLISVPLAPVRMAMAALEFVSHRIAPFTTGQLAAFRYDGTATPNDYWSKRCATLVSADEMIRRSLAT